MRLFTCLALSSVTIALLIAGCKPTVPEDPFIARWHFAGVSKFAQLTNAPGLHAVTTTRSAAAAGDQMAKRLSETLWLVVTGQTNAPEPVVQAAAPLWRELVQAESAGTVFDTPTHLEFAFCARIPAARADAWRAGLIQFFSTAKGGDIGVFVGHTNGLLTVAFPATAMSKAPSIASRLATVPADGVLDADLELSKWSQSPWPKALLPAPRAKVTSVATNQIVRTTVSLKFPEALKIEMEPWQLPTFLMNDLTRSLTAIRGIRPMVAKSPWFQSYEPNAVPNQFTIWMQPLTELQTYVGFPVGNSQSFMASLTNQLGKFFTGENPAVMGMLNVSTNGQGLLIDQIPIQGPPPNLSVVRTNNISYIAGGFFPSKRTTNPVPAALLKQLEKPDLIAYSWEITEQSIKHWLVLSQLRGIVFRRYPIPLQAPGQVWLDEVTSKLGNTATEVRLAAPNEVILTRSAPGGLAGLELVALARWIDGPGKPIKGNPRSALPKGVSPPPPRAN